MKQITKTWIGIGLITIIIEVYHIMQSTIEVTPEFTAWFLVQFSVFLAFFMWDHVTSEE
jgi:hypothetical protein